MSPVSRKLVPVLATLAILPLASCSDERTLTQPPEGTRYITPTGLLTANPPQILAGAGDISECGTNNNDEATAQLLDVIPGTVFTAGDNVMPNGTTSEFANCYDPTWGRHKGRTRPAAGNHDYNTSGAAGYFAYFGAAAGEPGKGYYSYALGAWHIVVLNSNIATAAGSARTGSAAAAVQAQAARTAASDRDCLMRKLRPLVGCDCRASPSGYYRIGGHVPAPGPETRHPLLLQYPPRAGRRRRRRRRRSTSSRTRRARRRYTPRRRRASGSEGST